MSDLDLINFVCFRCKYVACLEIEDFLEIEDDNQRMTCKRCDFDLVSRYQMLTNHGKVMS